MNVNNINQCKIEKQIAHNLECCMPFKIKNCKQYSLKSENS